MGFSEYILLNIWDHFNASILLNTLSLSYKLKAQTSWNKDNSKCEGNSYPASSYYWGFSSTHTYLSEVVGFTWNIFYFLSHFSIFFNIIFYVFSYQFIYNLIEHQIYNYIEKILDENSKF